MAPGAGSWKVSTTRQDRGLGLDQTVRRQAAGTFADAHRAACGMEADADRARRLDRVLEAHAIRKDIEVVRAQRAAGKRQLGEPDLRGDEHVVGLHPRPDRIERLQPAKKQRVLSGGNRPGQDLIKVVVSVHEARRHHASGGVDHLVRRIRFRAGPPRGDRCDRCDHPAVNPHVADKLAPVVIHGRDRRVADDKARHVHPPLRGTSTMPAHRRRVTGESRRNKRRGHLVRRGVRQFRAAVTMNSTR
jgi:hypothetical protein